MHAYSWVDISADWKSYCCGCTCGLDLVLSPHLNSDLAWIQIAGVFTLRYPLVLSASIVLEYCAWTLSVNIANVLISSVRQIQRGSRGGAQGPRTPFLSDQTEAQRAEKNVLETAPLHISGSGCPPPYLNVWMRHWNWPGRNDVVALRRYFPSCFINSTCLFGSNSWLHVTDTGWLQRILTRNNQNR